jgi:membrane fusion protein (multidrug efflux system)
VKGYLEAVEFKEGGFVKEGEPLYAIEKGLFQAAVQQAQGEVENAKAKYDDAVKNRHRAEQLVASNAGTVKTLDDAIATEGEAKGAVLTTQANLATAQINLGYTDIVTPISGKIGRTALTKGNVVGPDSGVLATIVSQDPMYVTFPVSQADFLHISQQKLASAEKSIKARIRFSDGTLYDAVGEINFVDVTVNRATDTILVRATMPNPDGRLVDNQLVQVILESGTPEEKILIPQAALIADQEGLYVFVVDGGKAAIRRVKTGGENGADIIVDKGLSGGELVIVEGLQSVRAGAEVRANPLPQALSRG